jgi:hypothetical protein
MKTVCNSELNSPQKSQRDAKGTNSLFAVHLATLPADGPTGGFFNEDGALPW